MNDNHAKSFEVLTRDFNSLWWFEYDPIKATKATTTDPRVAQIGRIIFEF